MIKITRHKDTRQWAVWRNDELIAVVCYKKGAMAIKQILTQHLNKPAKNKPTE